MRTKVLDRQFRVYGMRFWRRHSRNRCSDRCHVHFHFYPVDFNRRDVTDRGTLFE